MKNWKFSKKYIDIISNPFKFSQCQQIPPLFFRRDSLTSYHLCYTRPMANVRLKVHSALACRVPTKLSMIFSLFERNNLYSELFWSFSRSYKEKTVCQPTFRNWVYELQVWEFSQFLTNYLTNHRPRIWLITQITHSYWAERDKQKAPIRSPSLKHHSTFK